MGIGNIGLEGVKDVKDGPKRKDTEKSLVRRELGARVSFQWYGCSLVASLAFEQRAYLLLSTKPTLEHHIYPANPSSWF